MNKTEFLSLKGSDVFLGKLVTFPNSQGGGCRFFYSRVTGTFDGEATKEPFAKDFPSRPAFITWLNVPEAAIKTSVEVAE